MVFNKSKFKSTITQLITLGIILGIISSAHAIAGISIVDYGEYVTQDDPKSIEPNWKHVRKTTEIKIGANNGFGIRFILPGPYSEKLPVAKVSMLGAYGQPGVVGYEFNITCKMIDGQCVAKLISPCKGFSELRPGQYAMKDLRNIEPLINRLNPEHFSKAGIVIADSFKSKLLQEFK